MERRLRQNLTPDGEAELGWLKREPSNIPQRFADPRSNQLRQPGIGPNTYGPPSPRIDAEPGQLKVSLAASKTTTSSVAKPENRQRFNQVRRCISYPVERRHTNVTSVDQSLACDWHRKNSRRKSTMRIEGRPRPNSRRTADVTTQLEKFPPRSAPVPSAPQRFETESFTFGWCVKREFADDG